MKKTDTFFVIDNFNTVPLELIAYTNNYVIYDASTNPEIEEELKKNGLNYKKVKRTGHNISSYFLYFVDNYEKLPDYICLTKGHMIGRHCSKEFFDRVYDNKTFTGLFDASGLNGLENIPLCGENYFVEKINKGELIYDRPQKFFLDASEMYNFLYENNNTSVGGGIGYFPQVANI